MEEHKFAWNVLLSKFVYNEIDDEELNELFRQMEESEDLLEQFNRANLPLSHPDCLLQSIDRPEKEVESIIRFQAKLDAHFGAKDKGSE